MSRPLPLADHLSTDDLRQRMQQADTARLRARLQVIYLVSQGQSAPRVAHTVGYHPNWVRSLVHRYNREGEAGLDDGRRDNPGRTPYLSPEQQAQLTAALEERHHDGGLWNGPKVARWIAQQTGREQVHPQLGWDYLKRLGFSAQHPRRRHAEADLAEQAAFKKS